VRTRLVVGNWKMHKTATEATLLVGRLAELAGVMASIDVVLAPPFTALAAVAELCRPGPFLLAAQNVFWEDQGAYTGEISGPMLTDLGCRFVIVGHSERRRLFGERDDGINKKIHAALRHGLRPILCVGESLEERDHGRTGTVVTRQLEAGLAQVGPEQLSSIVIAYEPVWAIGTGRAASPGQAQEVHRLIRDLLAGRGQSGADVRILYGGSVTAQNAGAFFGEPEVDGALVGGACLDPVSFATIIRLALSGTES
jgi:triosephosphate isomerase